MLGDRDSSLPRPQGAEVAYELHTLGWKAFQNLCTTILADIFGQTIQGFFDSHDGGRDGAFYGQWKSKSGELFEGSFTVQCKFTAKPDKKLSVAGLKDELGKAARLASRGLAKNYFLLSNAQLTGTNDEKIRKAFEELPGVEKCFIFGVERISQIIRESPRLRMLVPRIYGLGDLGQILDVRAQEQAKEILSSLGEDLGKFVITDAYRRSAKALVDHGFVLLLGEPACGKSTIAAALALGALDEWGCSTFKARGANEFVGHSNPHDPKQFFWVDDAFGATQMDWSLVSEWNGVFSHMNAAIRRGARVLFTSRDYIYQSARRILKESALPVFRESQVVIQVENMTKEEREQILYNHIKLGRQPLVLKKRIKYFLPEVAAHPRFSPEIARRLGEPLFTKELVVSKDGLGEFVENSVASLCEIIRTIDQGSRSALALVFMRGGSVPSPVTMTVDEQNAIVLMGGNQSEVRNALNALNGSLLLQSVKEGVYTWQFKHPTVRDAFAEVLAEDRELMDIYLSGAPIERLFGEVTCGEVGVKGAKVIVPSDRYELILNRLKEIDVKSWDARSRLYRFMTYRCDGRFLADYLERHPRFLSKLHTMSYLLVVPDVDLMARLHGFGLLPEEKRLEVAKGIRQLAVATPDSGFLRERIRKLLTADEFDEILEDVRVKLLPNLESVIEDWKLNFNEEENSPEGHFDELVGALEDFREALADDPECWESVETGLSNIKDAIKEMENYSIREPDYDGFEASDLGAIKDEGDRSIFDDVDQ